MLWGFLLPLAVMLLFNTVVLVYFSVVTCRTDPKLRSTQKNSPKKKLLSSFSLGVILGLSWILGYLLLTADKNIYILSIVFCVLNTTQGLQIFILFTARTSVFRKTFFQLLNSVPVPRIALHHQKFYLWRKRKTRHDESYTPIDLESTSQL
ncbi:hypothetical protein AAFF_G00331360 [Aldrovandia affinis]|uniref:G-protein coupled receptors family 2 profile 2 domain-containing protein n=1 Tax=Aldrovandia affinis TaxID=143900 RepID=A0AAD7R746_9TELE|nr:hypothetical protein AAFF_G00331360 [Aldrovandia affinis]